MRFCLFFRSKNRAMLLFSRGDLHLVSPCLLTGIRLICCKIVVNRPFWRRVGGSILCLVLLKN